MVISYTLSPFFVKSHNLVDYLRIISSSFDGLSDEVGISTYKIEIN